jgi:hypothetical protein
MCFCICISSIASIRVEPEVSVTSLSNGIGYGQDQCLGAIESDKRDIQESLELIVYELKTMSVGEWKRDGDNNSNVD